MYWKGWLEKLRTTFEIEFNQLVNWFRVSFVCNANSPRADNFRFAGYNGTLYRTFDVAEIGRYFFEKAGCLERTIKLSEKSRTGEEFRKFVDEKLQEYCELMTRQDEWIELLMDQLSNESL